MLRQYCFDLVLKFCKKLAELLMHFLSLYKKFFRSELIVGVNLIFGIVRQISDQGQTPSRKSAIGGLLRGSGSRAPSAQILYF